MGSASQVNPPLPPGFELESRAAPPLPPGFEIEGPKKPEDKLLTFGETMVEGGKHLGRAIIAPITGIPTAITEVANFLKSPNEWAKKHFDPSQANSVPGAAGDPVSEAVGLAGMAALPGSGAATKKTLSKIPAAARAVVTDVIDNPVARDVVGVISPRMGRALDTAASVRDAMAKRKQAANAPVEAAAPPVVAPEPVPTVPTPSYGPPTPVIEAVAPPPATVRPTPTPGPVLVPKSPAPVTPPAPEMLYAPKGPSTPPPEGVGPQTWARLEGLSNPVKEQILERQYGRKFDLSGPPPLTKSDIKPKAAEIAQQLHDEMQASGTLAELPKDTKIPASVYEAEARHLKSDTVARALHENGISSADARKLMNVSDWKTVFEGVGEYEAGKFSGDPTATIGQTLVKLRGLEKAAKIKVIDTPSAGSANLNVGDSVTWNVNGKTKTGTLQALGGPESMLPADFHTIRTGPNARDIRHVRAGILTKAEPPTKPDAKPDAKPTPKTSTTEATGWKDGKYFVEKIPALNPDIPAGFTINQLENGQYQPQSFSTRHNASFANYSFDTLKEARAQVARWNAEYSDTASGGAATRAAFTEKMKPTVDRLVKIYQTKGRAAAQKEFDGVSSDFGTSEVAALRQQFQTAARAAGPAEAASAKPDAATAAQALADAMKESGSLPAAKPKTRRAKK